MARAARAPWKRQNPHKRAGKESRHLTSAQKSTAKARARRAGRPYPNLVDNMRMASKASKKKAAKKRPAKNTGRKRAAKKIAKKASRKKAPKKAAATGPAKTRENDPKAGLTAAGRSAFARRDGSHLKPGVTKTLSEMTPQDMRRKGSWAVRFYGRKNFLRWSTTKVGRRGTRCPPTPGENLFLARSQRRGASRPWANGCCNAIGESSKSPDACKRK